MLFRSRLNKFIANAGICSRREADDLIKSGCVTVNGKIITELGFKIKEGDVVVLPTQGPTKVNFEYNEYWTCPENMVCAVIEQN